ncbi:chemotaxis protein CheB [Parasediminibacterium sp. JCM 36343]|uniref:chemotaxis protein CheB n=1 Tax=Parasediminibacterium sp. JCM 36343 TaxID=3374279 RepID=UPI00397A9D6B
MKEAKDGAKIKSANLFPVVGIGASAGGLEAFKKLLKAIPENSGIAYVLVQHLDPTHESMLPSLLQKATKLPVLEITDDIKVQPNHVYILPSNKMMVANDGVLELSPRTTNKGELNLPIDLFFNSLAEVHQSRAIGVVLSGTGSDGTKGLKAIKENGGITFAQDEESAAYEGMPNSAVLADVVDFILPPEKIVQKILEVTAMLGKSDSVTESLSQQYEDMFRQIIAVIRLRKGTDFTYYKQTTIRRRILRRMTLNKNEDPGAYVTFLRENKAEQDILYQDLLIPVTSFFRDHHVFVNLLESVFPQIIKNKNTTDPIRIWVAACSTGQEAYSIAIALKQFLGTGEERVQIFATDLNPQAIAKARTGIYGKSELDGLSTQQLKDFFTKTDGGYQVNKQIRDMCLFAAHNFLKDPPFGKVDFISCRNVLIYMEPYLQKKALTTFHYALNPKGILLLGKSETSTGVPDLFSPSGTHEKIFTRKDVPGKYMLTASNRSEQDMQKTYDSVKGENLRTDFQKTADDIILSKYTPAGVVVNDAMDIVHYRGKTASYLEQMPGKPSQNLLQLAKNGLAFELRNLLYKVKKEQATVLKDNILIVENGHQRNISIEAMLLPDTIEPHYLILFHDNRSANSQQLLVGTKKSISGKAKKDANNLRIEQLEKELAQTREDMRGITEDQEAVNEELQTANEELMSGSEELQSLNEELESSKEELQSTNEELTVVNQETIGLNEQITEAKDYAEAIIATIRQPMLILDKTLHVKTANKAYYELFKAKEADVEGKLIFDISNKQWDIPKLKSLLEKILPDKSYFNDCEITKAISLNESRTFLMNAREIIKEKKTEKLILLSIEDVTEKNNAWKKIAESEKKFRLLTNAMPQKITNADAAGNVTFFNQQWLDDTGYTFEELKDWGWEKAMHPDDRELTKKNWINAVATGNMFDMECRIKNKNGQYRWHLSRAVPIKDENGKITMWVGSNTDIQEQKEYEATLEAAVKERTKELELANKELAIQNKEKEKRAAALIVANDELTYQNEEKKKRAAELTIANDELTYQNAEKEKRAAELAIANDELTYQNAEKEKRAAELAIANDELTYQNAEKEKRAAELAIANEELTYQNAEKEKRAAELGIVNNELVAFTYVSSHDLQEPLRKIQTLASRILDNEHKNLSPTGKDYFARMQSSAGRMQQLLQDLLAYARVNNAERVFESIDLNIIMEDVIHGLKEIIEEKHATIEAYDLCAANIIAFQFHQLMQNLITNALKFSRPGIPPHIVIKSAIAKGRVLNKQNAALAPGRLSPNKDYCHISFADNGIGFAPEYSDKIFQVFQRLHSKDEYTGTGIGLAIVKKIVENHYGVITATGEVNKGATFDIYTPYNVD